MSAAVLCNNLVLTRYRSGFLLFVRFQDHYSQDTVAKISVRSVGSWQPANSQLPKLSVRLEASAIRLLIRFWPGCASSVRELKVSASSAVPFREGNVVLINCIQKSAFGPQKAVLSYAVLKWRHQTTGDVLLNRLGAFLRSGSGGRK